MPSISKSFILDEIRRLAEEGDGKPPGAQRFQSVTGIGVTDWRGAYWARWGDALVDAGFSPNQWTAPIEIRQLLESYAKFALELGHLPVDAELTMKRRGDREFPNKSVFHNRFGNKRELVRAVTEFCKRDSSYEQGRLG